MAARPMQISLVNGAPRARALKIWSSRASPPAKARSTTFSPLAARSEAYSWALECSRMEGTPQVSIMFQGLMPVPPPEPSMVSRSSLASVAYLMAMARASMP